MRRPVPMQQNPNPPNGVPMAQPPMAPAPMAPGAFQQVQLPEALVNQLPGRSQAGRVVVGAHVYEFRAVDVPNVDHIPAVQNVSENEKNIETPR